MPDVTGAIQSYQVTALQESDEVAASFNVDGGNELVLEGLTAGTWNITVEGLSGSDGSGEILARGTAQAEIAAADNTVSVALDFLREGSGSVAITVEFPDTVGVTRVQAEFAAEAPTDLTVADAGEINGEAYSRVEFTRDPAASGEKDLVIRFFGSGVDAAETEIGPPLDLLLHVYDNLATAKTLTLDASRMNSPPEAPTLAEAAATGPMGIDLSWQDESSFESGYRVYRGTTAGDLSLQAELDANTTAWSDTSVHPQTQYYYAVEAVNSLGGSEQATAAATTGDIAIIDYTPAADAGDISVDGLEIRLQFNVPLDSAQAGNVSFGFAEAPYLDAAGFATAEYDSYKAAYPLDEVFPFVEFEEAEISFATTVHPNDTVVITPDEALAMSTYARPVVSGFRYDLPADSGLDPIVMPQWEDQSYRFQTAPINLSSTVDDWRERVIYFALTDRFNDGDSGNNQFMSGSKSEYSADGDGRLYQGGDLQGLIDQMDYLQELGITALWITAPVTQAWENADYASYHGYWAQDYTSVDPHLGDMNLLREMVSAAHARGIAVIMDIVVNHAGSLFYYPDEDSPWEPAFGGPYTTAWLEDVNDTFTDDFVDANRVRPMPVEFQNWDWFHRMGGNATTGGGTMPAGERYAGDFAGLRDVATTNSDVRTKLAAIFTWWIANTNIDGFRIDTVGHVETEFWNGFTSSIRDWASSPEGGNKDFYMVAEVYSNDLPTLDGYTGTNMLDSVLGFHMQGAVFNWNGDVTDGSKNNIFRDGGVWDNRTKTAAMENLLGDVVGHTGFNTAPTHGGALTAADGTTALTPRQTVGYFIDNHDLYRFLQDDSNTENDAPSAGEVTNLQMALGWLLTWEGLPVVYYGTEQNYQQSLLLDNGGEHGDGTGNVNKGNRPNLWQISHAAQGNTPFNTENNSFRMIRTLSNLRTDYPELGKGYAKIVWSDQDGTGDDAGYLAYMRHYGATTGVGDDILVVLNTHPTQYSAGSFGSGNDMKLGKVDEWGWPVGTTLEPVSFDTIEAGLESGTVLNSTLYDYTDDPDNPVLMADNQVTTSSQQLDGEDYSAVYFMVPPNSVTLLQVVEQRDAAAWK